MKKTQQGTYVKFASVGGVNAIVLRLKKGQKVTRLVAPDVAQALAEKYGVLDRQNRNVRHLKSLAGSAVRYRETSQGLVVELEILPN